MPHALGIDVSTQSCSAILIDPQEGKIVAEHSINFGQHLPQYHAPAGFIPKRQDGQVHADPGMWLEALDLLLSEFAARADLSQVGAVCGAAQQHGSVYLNAAWQQALRTLGDAASLSAHICSCLSRATSPIWMDSSTSRQCKAITEAVGGSDVVCKKSGSVAIERFTGPQIRRFAEEEPDAYAQTVRIHLISSFLASVLTGEDAPIDTGDGAGMNLLNVSTWQWDEALLEATASGLRARLPQVVKGDQVVGRLSPYFTHKYGLPAEIPVLVFTGDNPSSLVGMGASRPGRVVISLGTSDTLFAGMPAVVTDPQGYGHVFGNPSGGAMSLQCFSNGSLAREAVRDRFGYDWDAFSAALEQTPPGNSGNLMLPFFQPEISPRLSSASPWLEGSDTFEAWEDAPSAVRACVEGQFLNMRLRTAWMQLKTDVIYLTGGASQNDALAQTVADIFGARVERLAMSGSVALGAAMRAAQVVLGVPLSALEEAFCQAVPNSAKEQAANTADTYRAMQERLQSYLADKL
ncbi:MAG: FGGY family carbohydrate kinase [Verrucomicrobiota bacterium]